MCPIIRLIIMDIIRPGLDLQQSWRLVSTAVIIITVMVVIMEVITMEAITMLLLIPGTEII